MLQADANGHVYVARITLEALREGQVELRFGSRTQGIPPVQLLYIDENSNLAVYQDIDFGDPAARIIVGEVKAQMDLIQTVDPADGVARVQYRIDDVGGQRLASFSSILRFDSTCMEILRVDSDRGGFFSSISGDEVELGATALGGLEAPEQLAGITTRLIGDKDTVCSMELVSGEFVPTSGSPIPAAGSIEEGAIINGSIVFTLNELDDTEPTPPGFVGPSGQFGIAVLTDQGATMLVELFLSPGVKKSTAVHIHEGQCSPPKSNLLGATDTLTSFVGGSGPSVTVVNATLDSLMDGNHAINTHNSVNADNYTTCGNIPTPGELAPLVSIDLQRGDADAGADSVPDGT